MKKWVEMICGSRAGPEGGAELKRCPSMGRNLSPQLYFFTLPRTRATLLAWGFLAKELRQEERGKRGAV